MTYEDSGFNNLLSRNNLEAPKNDLSEDEASYKTSQLSGTNVTSGKSISTSGKISIDWDKEFINITNGARSRIEMGNIGGTGNYGIRISDEKGNTRLEVSDKLQQFSAYDTSFNQLVKIDSNGFHAYDTSGNELIKVDSTGLHGYLTGGTETLRVSGTGIEGYGDTGNTFKFYDQQGGTQYGQIGYLSSGPYFYVSGLNGAKPYFTGQTAAVASTNTDTDSLTVTAINGGMHIVSRKDLDLFSASENVNLTTSNNSGKGIYLKGGDTGNVNSTGVYFWNWDLNAYVELLL